MILQLLSDLHFEQHRDGGESFLRTLDPSGVDVLVVAGDVHTSKRGLPNTLLVLAALYPHVIFVCGNHEYYGWRPNKVHDRLAILDRDVLNFHWLHHQAVEIDGVRFAGTPLWFPKPTNPLVMADRFQINDFNLIKQFEPWVYKEHRRAMEFLSVEGPKADIIVTHHVPTALCTSQRFKADTTNHYFVTDMTGRIIEWEPKLWLFGHSHDRMWHQLNSTLLACNPFGYPWEQMELERGCYLERCLIDVGSEGASFVGNACPGWPYPGPMQGGPIVTAGG